MLREHDFECYDYPNPLGTVEAVNQTTLILEHPYGGDNKPLHEAAIARGWLVQSPARYELRWAPLGPLGVYGPLDFCDVMADRLMLGLLEPPDGWLASLPQKYLKREVQAKTVADLHTIKTRSFIKPANDKVFEARIFQFGKDVPTRYLSPTCPILVAEVVEFDCEVRLYILDRKVVTASGYSGASSKVLTEAAIEWTADLLAEPDLDLPSSVVIDVGHMEGRGWAVVEANQLYASGIYEEADASMCLDPIVRAAGALELVSAADMKYLRLPVTPGRVEPGSAATGETLPTELPPSAPGSSPPSG